MKRTLLVVLSFFAFTLSADVVPPAPQPFTESMVVTAIRAEEETPVTKTDMPAEEIEKRYHGQDVPLLLRETPSINAYAESGVGGAGYSYISLRGIGSTRINFTLDGVPLADSEDLGTYFADFPDLARSIESIQIQRGVGTSTVGSPSFAGSVNMESIDLWRDPFLRATLGFGSFGNTQVSVGTKIDASLTTDVYLRLSYLESDGFREHSGMRQRNVFLSAARQLGDAQLKLTGFSGREHQQLSFYASDAATLESNLRDNPLRPEEKDSFGYDLAQLSYTTPVRMSTMMTASAYYQRGYGWYRLFDSGTDVLREYGVDGVLLGGMVTYFYSANGVTANAGFHANRFKRDHTRDDLSTATRDYANYGEKGEANAFAKVEWDLGRWHLYGDAQVRHAGFEYHGDVDIEPISWTFFNPKIGARYWVNARSTVYGSIGMSTREPARNDMFNGEDNPSVAHDLSAVRPERVYDLEAGWQYRAPRVDLTANVYAMEFRQEIASTGELSEIGLLLRRNVDRSYRRGLELDLAYAATPKLRLRTNANVSRNRIDEWTQFYDATAIAYRDVEPLLTPNVIVSQAADWSPNARFSVSGIGRWVGRSYLDNTNNDALTTPSFFVLDGNVSYRVTDWARVSLQVNNALNNDRVYASGYSWLYLENGQPAGIPYYFPQATRNAVVLVDLDW
jgi:iron complex outermembrane recepter protein